MKHFLALACAVLAAASFTAASWAADFSRLIILHTNDTHGYDRREEGVNGMAAIAALKKDLERRGYAVLLLDAGDAIQDNNLVNFSKGRTAIRFMNAAGYDAATLGNHEFDYGQEVLEQRILEANYPVVSANIVVEATGRNLIPSHVILEKNGIKIGILGLTTPETVVSTNPKNVAGLTFIGDEALWKLAQEQVNQLKKAGCELIIVLGHLGSEASCAGSRSDDVLQHVEGIDIFIDGHDHKVKDRRIHGALLVETGCHTNNIGQLRHENGQWRSMPLAYGVWQREDPLVKQLVDEAAAEITNYFAAKVGKTDFMLDGQRDPGVRTQETNLANFCADAFLWQAIQAQALTGETVHAAIVNGGSIRDSIPAGDITRGQLHGVFPYNDQLYVMKITGAKLLEILEAATSALPDAMGSLPQVAGIKYRVNVKVPYEKGERYEQSIFYAPLHPGSRVTIDEVAGRPFMPDALYNIVTAEFVGNGGDAYGGLVGPDARQAYRSIGYIDVDALTNYLQTALEGKVDERYAHPAGRLIVQKE
ncbi:MAG: bifunctional metallophosphatase/5'-nucleotidase [bacterium]|nr:bifunctional metallophosphatase/5'-nucleotidase [bacterium]